MSVDRMAQDGLEVAEILRHHLRKDKIILLGFSWGSLLGMAKLPTAVRSLLLFRL